MGTLTFGTDTGGVSYMYDEEVPQVYEQTSDAQQNSANIVGNALDSNYVAYTAPALELGGATVNIGVEYSPQAADAGANDGGQHTYSEVRGSGMGAGVTIAYDALKVGVYAAEIENVKPDPWWPEDHFEGVWYAKYSFGPVSIGYSESYLENGLADTDNVAEAANVAKTVKQLLVFLHQTYSIAFNVNDNSQFLTQKLKILTMRNDKATNIADVTQETEALQLLTQWVQCQWKLIQWKLQIQGMITMLRKRT